MTDWKQKAMSIVYSERRMALPSCYECMGYDDALLEAEIAKALKEAAERAALDERQALGDKIAEAWERAAAQEREECVAADVERVARAICVSVGRDPDMPFVGLHGRKADFPEWERWQGEAIAAIRAYARLPSEPGWQLVPKEPTEEMINAGEPESRGEGVEEIWRAMLAAAPTPHSGNKKAADPAWAGG